ncbi:MAG: DUF1343 domain-containing protein [Chitinophagaceae bacterium]|nr:DUF1343 domain-containing protein [Chitinophagaceae bacterium]MCW5905928.1 DUF1343 domain-containing protein [Chitinophagaceae bacterium]
MLLFGIDNLVLQNPAWKKQKIAFVTNHAATNNQLISSRKILLQNGFNIIKLFSPEHGLDIQGADGTAINNTIDALTNLPIISLYNKKLQPSEEDLKDVDIVLFDIPDIGCRYYTYLWTMTYVLEACANYHTPFIILDRPNPISGNLSLAEGAMLNETFCSSFIGRWNIPLRHSCTLGELALYFNSTKNLHANIEVIHTKHWQRNMFHNDWHIDFIPTSPAIQHFNAALLYTGLGLLEATNVSEGRGANTPFEIAGAAYLQHNKICTVFNTMQDAVVLKPIQFTPTFGKYKNELCNGVKFYIQDFTSYQAVFTALLFMKVVKDLHTHYFTWSNYPTIVNPTGERHLDKLLGIPSSEEIFDLPMQLFLKRIEQETHIPEWKKEINSYLLYE